MLGKDMKNIFMFGLCFLIRSKESEHFFANGCRTVQTSGEATAAAGVPANAYRDRQEGAYRRGDA